MAFGGIPASGIIVQIKATLHSPHVNGGFNVCYVDVGGDVGVYNYYVNWDSCGRNFMLHSPYVNYGSNAYYVYPGGYVYDYYDDSYWDSCGCFRSPCTLSGPPQRRRLCVRR